MSNSLFNYFIAGSLGVLLQIFAVKIPTLTAKYKVANKVFTFKQYLMDDWYTIIASFLSVGVLIYGIDEILSIKPELAKYIKWLFVFVGFTGSSIIQAVLSVANKKVMDFINIKTDLVDGVPVSSADLEKIKQGNTK